MADGQLIQDLEEIVDLVSEDLYEGLVYEGDSGDEDFEGAFILGAASLDVDSPGGETLLDKATVIFTEDAITPEEGRHITRSADSTEWSILTVNRAQYGLVVLDLQDATRKTQGRF